MRNGYRIEWTDNALSELKLTFDYIEKNWTEKESRKLSIEIEKTVNLISNNPNLFPLTDSKNIRKAVIKKLNILYYREKENKRIEILSFFSCRQNPDKRKI